MRALKCQKLVLTTGFLNKLKSDIDLQITDAALPGLQCRYSAASGRKVFYLGYRVRGSYQQKHMRLGTLAEFSLNEIRARAIQTKQDRYRQGPGPAIRTAHTHKAKRNGCSTT